MVGGWFVGYMRAICGRRVGRRSVSRPRLGRRGCCWEMIIKQIELGSHRKIVSIWRAVLLVWVVWRVVGRVIVTRVAHGESGSRYSDDDEGGATDDRHGR